MKHEDTNLPPHKEYMSRKAYKAYMAGICRKAINKYTEDYMQQFNEWLKAEDWQLVDRAGIWSQIKNTGDLLAEFSKHYNPKS